MQKIQYTHNPLLSAKSPPITSVPVTSTGSSNTISVTSTVVSGLFPGQPLSHIDITIRIEPSMLARYILPQFGNQLAIMLAKVLDELEKNNREAIDPIVSILEPYMETNRDLKVNIRPKSSREITLKITKMGKVTPKIPLDESST
jgi:hypothetical protein